MFTIQFLIDDDLHRGIKLAFYAIRSHGADFADVESLATSEAAEHILLAISELCGVGHFGHYVTHIVEEVGLEAQHAERDVQQAVIHSSSYAIGIHQDLLLQFAALEAVFAALAVGICDEGCGIGNLRTRKVNLPISCTRPSVLAATVMMASPPGDAG